MPGRNVDGVVTLSTGAATPMGCAYKSTAVTDGRAAAPKGRPATLTLTKSLGPCDSVPRGVSVSGIVPAPPARSRRRPRLRRKSGGVPPGCCPGRRVTTRAGATVLSWPARS